MDIGTGLALLGSAKMAEKILGPTADYLGSGLKGWTEKRVGNVSKIFQQAEKILGDKINEDGQVPPKILKSILDNGQFCEDELTKNYFGGLLASSRTTDPMDDRAISYMNLIANMPSYQIKAHYLIYYVSKLNYSGDCEKHGWAKALTWIPYDSYNRFMGIMNDSKMVMNSEGYSYHNWDSILLHNISWLRNRGLVSVFTCGGAAELSRCYTGIRSPGLIFSPSTIGAELFLWVHGMSNVLVNDFFEKKVEIPYVLEVNEIDEFQKTTKV